MILPERLTALSTHSKEPDSQNADLRSSVKRLEDQIALLKHRATTAEGEDRSLSAKASTLSKELKVVNITSVEATRRCRELDTEDRHFHERG